MEEEVDINLFYEFIGAIFNRAFYDYFNRADKLYGDIPIEERNEEQRNRLKNQKDARRFIDRDKGGIYAALGSVNVEDAKRRYAKLYKKEIYDYEI